MSHRKKVKDSYIILHLINLESLVGGLINIGDICVLLKGNGTNIVRIIPYTAVQFAAYEEFKKVNNNASWLIGKQQN